MGLGRVPHLQVEQVDLLQVHLLLRSLYHLVGR